VRLPIERRWFQSSPAARGGRNAGTQLDVPAADRFNPRPLHAAGATHADGAERPRRVVSILARCTRRAQPARGAGRPRCHRVSILARCTRRAQPVKFAPERLTVLFQSSPAARGGRNSKSIVVNRWAIEFQSSPAARGGRNASSVAR